MVGLAKVRKVDFTSDAPCRGLVLKTAMGLKLGAAQLAVRRADPAWENQGATVTAEQNLALP